MRLSQIVMVALVGLAGCSVLPGGPEDGPAPPESLSAAREAIEGAEADPGSPLYWALVGEVARNRGDLALATRAYGRAAARSNDPDVAERATQAALAADDPRAALGAAERWAELAPDALEPHRILGALQLRTGDTAAATDTFLQAVARHPEGVSQGLASLQTLLVDEAGSAAALEVAAALRDEYPEQPRAHHLYAAVARAEGELDQALAAADRAIGLGSGTVAFHTQRAGILMDMDRTEEALAAIDETVERFPDELQPRLRRGWMLMQSGRVEQARGRFREIIEERGPVAEALYALGLIAVDDRRFGAANDYFRRVLETGNLQSDAHYQLGRIKARQGQPEAALRSLFQVQDGRFALEAQIEIARVLSQMGRMESAREHLKRLRDRNPGAAARIRQAEGQILFEQGRYEESYRVYDEALGEHPDDGDLLYGRALAADRMGDVQQALADLRRLLELRPEDPQALNALGYTLANRTDRYGEALEYIERAYRKTPDNAAVVDSLGWVHFKMGDYETAEQYLRRAHDMSRDPEIAAHLGELLWVTGRREQARQLWRDARDAFPDSDVLSRTMERLLP